MSTRLLRTAGPALLQKKVSIAGQKKILTSSCRFVTKQHGGGTRGILLLLLLFFSESLKYIISPSPPQINIEYRAYWFVLIETEWRGNNRIQCLLLSRMTERKTVWSPPICVSHDLNFWSFLPQSAVPIFLNTCSWLSVSHVSSHLENGKLTCWELIRR